MAIQSISYPSIYFAQKVLKCKMEEENMFYELPLGGGSFLRGGEHSLGDIKHALSNEPDILGTNGLSVTL